MTTSVKMAPGKVMNLVPAASDDPDERLSDNDTVHVHHGKDGYWFGTLLVADVPTSLVAHPQKGMVDVATRWLNRAELGLDGPVCFDCRRTLRRRLIGE